MKTDPINHIRLKIERANKHINAFERCERAFFENASYAMQIYSDAQTGDGFIKFVLTEPLSDDLFLIAGDCLYNLRASLDYLATATARLKKPNAKGAYFPFAGDAKEFTALRTQKKINKLPTAARPIIQSLKPYKGGNDLLWAINRVRNEDGHVFLIPLGTLGKVQSVSFMNIQNVELLSMKEMHRLDEGIPFAKLQQGSVFKPSEGFEDKAKIKIVGQIAFGDVDIVQGQPAVTTLNKMRDLCANITDIFERTMFN